MTSFSPVGGAIRCLTADESPETPSEALSTVNALNDASAANLQMRPTEAEIRNFIKERRMRARFFAAELFADPAWDVLLDLYAASLGQRRVSVTSVCQAAEVPLTTALRWLTTLEKADLVSRSKDPFDGRRFFVELTENGLASMDAYFSTIR